MMQSYIINYNLYEGDIFRRTLGIKVVISQYNSDFSKSINNSFYWFMNVVLIKLKERVKDFLLSDYNLKIIGICEKDNSLFFNGEDYFVTRIKMDKENEVFFRISANLMNSILENTLGGRGEQFAVEKMTELEAKILTSLNDYIYKGIAPFLSKNKNGVVEKNPNHVHLDFLTKDKNGIIGKLIISIPVDILPDIRPADLPINFDMGSFPSYKVSVKIICGKSQLTLYDIQHMESGDIVVLEDSNIKMMTLELFGHKKNFKLNPETSIITGIDDDGGKEMDNTANVSANMWDVIPVEISAEFEKVQITLGELKQISEGAIVDVSTIYENKVYLKVENKPIASGELIIINDKYAVRVEEVFSDKQKAAPAAPKQRAVAAPQQQTQSQPAAQQQAGGDDFNYDNFDIEDEDI